MPFLLTNLLMKLLYAYHIPIKIQNKKMFLHQTARPWTAGGAAGADGAGVQQPVGQAGSRGKGSYNNFKCVSLRDSKQNCSFIRANIRTFDSLFYLYHSNNEPRKIMHCSQFPPYRSARRNG